MLTFISQKIVFKHIRKMYVSAVEVTKHVECYRPLICRSKHLESLAYTSRSAQLLAYFVAQLPLLFRS
jgi:hypothetical protein